MKNSPTYNLKVVLQETGIKADTLRAWERRYGLPRPARSEGRHRLYSQQDIETIKWLIARQDEGLSISRAAQMWHSLSQNGQNPLLAITAELTPVENQPILPSAPAINEMRNVWINACLVYDETTSERVLAQCMALYPPETVCIEVLQKGLAQIGELWYKNQATVQQEHFASALAMRRLDTLLSAAPTPTRSGRVLICCPPGEDHIFIPLLFTLMLRYRGWNVVYLGANVPVFHLEATAQSTRPNLVILTAQRLYTAATLQETADLLHRHHYTVGYGGRVFNQMPNIRKRISGHFLGQTLEEAVQTVNHLLTFAPSPPEVEPISPEYAKAIQVYRVRQSAVESRVWEIIQHDNIPYEHVVNANLHLSHDILAGLTLGDMSLLNTGISWTEKLMMNYNLPLNILKHYLVAYHLAAQAILNEQGQPIIDWLTSLVDNQER